MRLIAAPLQIRRYALQGTDIAEAGLELTLRKALDEPLSIGIAPHGEDSGIEIHVPV